MTAHRFHAPDLHPGILDLSPNEAHHANAVMRLKPGDAVELFDGKGAIAVGTLQSSGKRGASVEVTEIQRVERPNSNPLVLAMAIPKSPRQSFLFEKCTELGVDAIWPITFDRSVVKTSASGVAKWERTIIEAGKQCRTAYLPEILSPLRFKEAVGTHRDDATHVVCDPSASTSIADPIRALDSGRSCVVWIGPEGGMTDHETEQLASRGAVMAKLGGNILRIETAAIAVAAAFALFAKSTD